MSFFDELKRRNVIKVAAAYLIVSWLLLQVSDTLVPALRLPDWFNSGVAFVLIIGFPLALIFAWAFEMTPEGLKKEKDVDRSESITHATGQKLNLAIIAILGLALAYFVADKFWLQPTEQPLAARAGADAPVPAGAAQPAQEDADDLSIAVLPFVNMSSDPEQEYFSDGLSEELLNLLAKVSELKVTSRSSAFSFKGLNVDIPTVATKLNVAHVLEGSVRKAGDKVRVTAQLIRARDDVHLWSETYDRELHDVFAIQDEIAQQVVAALQFRLLGRELSAATTDTRAYTLYLKGRHFHLAGYEAYPRAEAAYREALAIDPDYAPAWAGLSRTLRGLANRGDLDLHDGVEAAREAATRALELDPSLPEAWAALAALQFSHDWDWAGALGTAQTAVQNGPNNVEALQTLSRIQEGQGEVGKALDSAGRAVDLDPLDRSSLNRLGLAQWAAGDYAASEQTYRRLLELYPDADVAGMVLGVLLVLQGKAEEGLSYIEATEDEFWAAYGMAMVRHALGHGELADQALRHLIDEFGDIGAFQVASVFAWRGEADRAFEWLHIAYEQRDGGFTLILVDPAFKSLHADPRWAAMLDRVGLLPYWEAMQTGDSALDV